MVLRLDSWNKTTHSTRFFFSSLKPDFADFPHSIRSHWGVENQLHWCLDVIFSEDDSRIRQDHAPPNMTILKRLALNLLRQDNSKGSLKMKSYKNLILCKIANIIINQLTHNQLF